MNLSDAIPRPSKLILKNTEQNFVSYIEKLQTTQSVQDELPANRFTRSQIEKQYQEAYNQGKATGYADGYASGESKGFEIGLETGQDQAHQLLSDQHQQTITDFQNQLTQLVQQAHQEKEAWFQAAEETLAPLAIEIARRALGRELEQDPDHVRAIAKQVLQEATEGTKIRLRVNIADAPNLEPYKHDLLQAFTHLREIEIISDPSVKHGCIIESDAGIVDARIESFLARIAEDMTGDAA